MNLDSKMHKSDNIRAPPLLYFDTQAQLGHTQDELDAIGIHIECPICYRTLGIGDGIIVTCPQSCSFCAECIETCTAKHVADNTGTEMTCPGCRSKMNKMSFNRSFMEHIDSAVESARAAARKVDGDEGTLTWCFLFGMFI